ncbi:MAG: hypothetical protein QNJ55_04680 [Xenococcus sp. MO_188.B8]|nr:hypothetical protein [Xenococcus sp. MO_188.B8]
MNDIFTNIAGWIAAIILPIATISQLTKILQEKTAEGVSLITWFLFGVANIGLYLFTEKYLALQSLVGLLGTAVLDFVILGVALFYKRKELVVKS